MVKYFFPINLVLAYIVYKLVNCNGWIISSINGPLLIIIKRFLFISKDLFKLGDNSISARWDSLFAQLNCLGTIESTGLDLTVVLKVVFV